MKTEKEKDRRRFWAMVIIIFLLLLLFIIFRCQISERNEKLAAEQQEAFRRQAFEQAVEKAQRIADSIKRRADSIREDSLSRTANDTVGEVSPSPAKRAFPATPSAGGTPATPPEAEEQPLEAAPARKDSLPPQPSILPPPGRYYKPVNLRVECGEPKCETEISVGDSLNAVKGKIENYNKTGKVYFRATDSAGNASSWGAASYDMASDNNCSENSYPVPVKGKTVCVDAYEFPNKAGEKPRNMVSQSGANRLCEGAGKRLCSTEEWQAACRGNSNSRYPYGNSYNQTKCATDLKAAKEPSRSGFAEHCRSYYGMYDMSGNLWEWTSTPAQREGLFLVAGGAWNTQNASSCAETKFSFYPQNEYPFVGFRCCL
ncbi:MAG: SUMF1/EgtB/PvdO family nonheme iron enzyme [Candidatus Fibromonas sp.]|jgi:type II secretory pathway pseudopilin PulG|nr:SUMF1/EgtB/PvdO family nonheme iron enzyme [Candidatus Fibromonas sp.]